ncbi:MAG: hypothetical protein ACSHX0_10180 [Akkermansiaceae bacterium]
MQSTSSHSLRDQLVTFIQHDIPGLSDGKYQLKISQRLDDSQDTPINDGTLENTYNFAVLGDRFFLRRPSDIYTTFPADNATGEYTTVLPHVVFTNTKFPWTRSPTSTKPAELLASGQGTEKNVPTWLTVLLFDEDDIAAYPGLTLPPQSATIGDLFPPAAYSESTLCENCSYFDGATDTSALNVGDKPTDPIQTLDIPLELFWKIAPTIADLELLAHVRRVSLVKKPTMAGISDIGEPEGDFSIVFGTRLPQTQKRTFACLVSLEQLESYLPDHEDGGPPANNKFDGQKTLRLAVLRSWQFFSTGQPATFRDQLLELNGREATSSDDAPITNLRLTYSGDNIVIKDALKMGYVPLDNHLRTDEKTVSWYRGPLVPYPITTSKITFPISSPDQATVFDPTTGMFDLSYSSAWTVGRMTALQDTSFSTSLYLWKKGLTQQAINGVEEDIMSQQFSVVLNNGDQPAAMLDATHTPTARAVFHKMIQSLHLDKD